GDRPLCPPGFEAGTEIAVSEKPLFEARRGLRKQPGSEQEKGRRRQAGQDQPHSTERNAEPAGRLQQEAGHASAFPSPEKSRLISIAPPNGSDFGHMVLPPGFRVEHA